MTGGLTAGGGPLVLNFDQKVIVTDKAYLTLTGESILGAENLLSPRLEVTLPVTSAPVQELSVSFPHGLLGSARFRVEIAPGSFQDQDSELPSRHISLEFETVRDLTPPVNKRPNPNCNPNCNCNCNPN